MKQEVMLDYNKSCIIMISCISYVAIAVSFTEFKIATAKFKSSIFPM